MKKKAISNSTLLKAMMDPAEWHWVDFEKLDQEPKFLKAYNSGRLFRFLISGVSIMREGGKDILLKLALDFDKRKSKEKIQEDKKRYAKEKKDFRGLRNKNIASSLHGHLFRCLNGGTFYSLQRIATTSENIKSYYTHCMDDAYSQQLVQDTQEKYKTFAEQIPYEGKWSKKSNAQQEKYFQNLHVEFWDFIDPDQEIQRAVSRDFEKRKSNRGHIETSIDLRLDNTFVSTVKKNRDLFATGDQEAALLLLKKNVIEPSSISQGYFPSPYNKDHIFLDFVRTDNFVTLENLVSYGGDGTSQKEMDFIRDGLIKTFFKDPEKDVVKIGDNLKITKKDMSKKNNIVDFSMTYWMRPSFKKAMEMFFQQEQYRLQYLQALYFEKKNQVPGFRYASDDYMKAREAIIHYVHPGESVVLHKRNLLERSARHMSIVGVSALKTN